MAKFKNNSMLDFLATFFAEDRAISWILSDVLKSRTNCLFLGTLGFPSDFATLSSQEEEKASVICTLKQGFDDRYEATLNGHPCNDHVIHSGDYFASKNKSNGETVKTLFIATSDIQVGYKKYAPSKDTNIFIGRAPLNDILYDFSDFVSGEKCAVIRIDSNGNTFIEDLKRSIGICANGRLAHSQQLKPLDEVFIMGLSLIYMGDFIAVCNLKTESILSLMISFAVKMLINDVAEKKYFVSTPHTLKSLDSDVIEIDAPPSPSTVDKTPAILTLGPSVTISMVMLVSLGVSITNAISGGQMLTIITGGTMAVGLLLDSLMWPSLLKSYQKRRTSADENHRKSRYLPYVFNIEKNLISRRK